NLIEKINQEGVLAAEKKARVIEEEARLKAEEIITNARAEAQRMISLAKIEVLKDGEREKALLFQAGRDMLLLLKSQLNSMLNQVINTEIRQALNTGELFKILSNLIQNICKQHDASIIVSLSKEDLEKLESGFLLKLKEQTKKEIVLHPAEDIRAGFTISFDAGKSQFDFSDKALSEYISAYLKPKLKEILQK
ncbi:MAG: hypothetical protein KJ926_02850, partial [Candidatus Omnitrophica bacterium]|nr:hypothetical protein [Candidatus Omnitrophota bacterium]